MRPDFAALHAAARRERSAEIYRLIVAPLLRYFRKPRTARTDLRVAACH